MDKSCLIRYTTEEHVSQGQTRNARQIGAEALRSGKGLLGNVQLVFNGRHHNLLAATIGSVFQPKRSQKAGRRFAGSAGLFARSKSASKLSVA